MSGGTRRAGEAAIDRTLAAYLRKEVRPYSSYYCRELQALEDGSRAITGVASLTRLAFTRLSEVEDPGALVLRPDAESIGRAGEIGLTARLALAKAAKRETAFNQALDRDFKPVLWWIDAGVTLGASSSDERRLGDLGRQWLEGAGVESHDALVSVVPPGANLGFWQLWFGARSAGLSAIYLPSPPAPVELAGLQPAVLAGREADLRQMLDAAREARVRLDPLRTLLVIGAPLRDAGRRHLEETAAAVSGAKVVASAAWAPAGVRALWAECRGSQGVHLWSGTEVVEVVDGDGERVPLGVEGELIWTAVGWHGSVLLRLRTGVRARIETTPCRHCGALETVIPAEVPEAREAGETARARGRRSIAALTSRGRTRRGERT